MVSASDALHGALFALPFAVPLGVACLADDGPALLMRYMNPWTLPAWAWWSAWAVTRAGVGFWDHLVIMLVKMSKAKLLPTRSDPDKPVRFVPTWGCMASMVYLGINSFLEYLFVLNLTFYLWHSDAVPKTAGELGLVNTAVALYVMFAAMDVVYAPCHRFLHWAPVYPYVHKHHHRQVFPAQGYLDAGNEHPIEQVVGLSSTWFGVYCAVYLTGAHAATIFAFFNIHAALAMLNHSPYDIEFSVLGFTYSVGAHEMHHRCFTINYAQYFMFWDVAMGTWVNYEADHRAAMKAAKYSASYMGPRAKKAAKDVPPIVNANAATNVSNTSAETKKAA
mmetsp:Transcript_20192/g.52793  ORF Transcript_20192/g.52793 Transcript_20192/m.52793 type:complete len:335 (+) Transcript_20192:158-1162(+)